MKLIAIVGAICALSQAAFAQTGECKLIADAAARLACYDKAAPPAKVPVSTIDSGKYVDTISAEDALMNARLKNICRGC